MIRYGLGCACGHDFDGWFRSSADFDAQQARGLLSCPACGSGEVAKALMAPAVSTARSKEARETGMVAAPQPQAGDDVALVDERQVKLRQMLREVKAELTKNSEDVGDRFAEVARQIHADETDKRTVHGRATLDEAKALIDDGVAVQPLPAFPDDLN